MSPTLTTLPDPILLQILTYVLQTSPNTTLPLLTTSKKLYKLSKPLVYTTILLPAYSTGGYIQHFGLCQAEPAIEIKEDSEKARIAEEVVSILEKIPEGQLRSFRWDIRTKCPKAILTTLHTRQQNLETIIIHYPSFSLNPESPGSSSGSSSTTNTLTRKLKGLVSKHPSFTFNLPPFQNLQHLCIYGSIPKAEKEKLVTHINTILKNLKTFVIAELSTIHHFWQLQRHTAESNKHKKTKKPRELITYPLLETFASDDNILGSILSTQLNLDSISQLPNLRSFHSRCSLTPHLLSNFNPKVPILLKTLEVQGCKIEILSKFLLAFQGLKNLDILALPEEDYLDPTPILHHAATLKRLALWKVVQLNNRAPTMIPIPAPLMKSLGDGLPVLEEFCATLPREHDPFEPNQFQSLTLLWLYNNNPNPSSTNFTPEYPWLPPRNDNLKSFPQWTQTDNLTLERDLTTHPNLTIPKNLKAIAIGHCNRVINLETKANIRSIDNSMYTERLYERVKEGKADNAIAWRRIGMKDLVRKHPDLMSPYEDAFGVRLMERHYIFNSTEVNGVLDPL
ncbi:hypothetical protein TWF718_010433 [Orbilia javanica]|uniref:Uncharacterized protein n=1 Tax=Orbilia javanica TaxID=47235 RepID=A0AAN8RE21_9PEZI